MQYFKHTCLVLTLLSSTLTYAQFDDFCQGPNPYAAQAFTPYKTQGFKKCNIYIIENGAKLLTKEVTLNEKGLPVKCLIMTKDDNGKLTASETEEYTYSNAGFCTAYKRTWANGVVSGNETYVYNDKQQLVKKTDSYDVENAFVYTNNKVDSVFCKDYNFEENENGEPTNTKYLAAEMIIKYNYSEADKTLLLYTDNITKDDYGLHRYPFKTEKFTMNAQNYVEVYSSFREMEGYGYQITYTYNTEGILTATKFLSVMGEEQSTFEYVYEYSK